MCFWNEPHWTADVCEDGREKADKSQKCYECWAVIHAGETARHVQMWEHELCRVCDEDSEHYDPDSADPADLERCKGGKHSRGEEFECWICDQCTRLLDAIRRAELAAGCSPYEAQPMFGELSELGRDVWEEYPARFAALGLFDEIALIPRPDEEEHAEDLIEECPGYWCDLDGDDVPAGAELGGEA